MITKLLIVPILFILLAVNSCKKENQKTCWRLVDGLGNMLNEVCNKTESEMNAEYGSQYGFFRSSDPFYCWKVQQLPNPPNYIRNVPQYIIDKFLPGYTIEKVDCNSFCKWKILFKHQSKITGHFTPTTLKTETIMNVSDTCGKLFPGRIVVVSETADSIHTAEFSQRIDQY